MRPLQTENTETAPQMSPVSQQDYHDYRFMLLIRRTEETILDLFTQGKINGTTHTYIGQEANAVGIIGQLDSRKDFVVSNHRGHGHFLAYGGRLNDLLAEITGCSHGLCGGKGGSQHLKYGRFISNGILGGGAAMGCGLAMAEKLSGTNGVAVICLGDGSLGQGLVYESLNMASLWNLPVFYLVENNRYAQSTPINKGVAGSMIERGLAFGVRSEEIESTDIREIRLWGAEVLEYIQTTGKPFWGVIHSYRLGPHSKGDDCRSDDEIDCYRKRDPLVIQAGRLNQSRIEAAEAWVKRFLDEALQSCDGSFSRLPEKRTGK